ncbi:hypothetical protein PMAYCL1PPCAC_22242, partial [Pristionchus mayeri]
MLRIITPDQRARSMSPPNIISAPFNRTFLSRQIISKYFVMSFLLIKLGGINALLVASLEYVKVM